MLPNCSHLLIDFRTVFVFALGPFLPMKVIFSTLAKMANMAKMAIYGHLSRKGPGAKTKTVLKSVSKLQQFDSMPNLRFQTLLNKNPPIVVTVQEYDFSGVVLGGRIILSIFTQIRMILLMEMRYKRARVKTLDSLISSLQIPGDTGDHHPERFRLSMGTYLFENGNNGMKCDFNMRPSQID